LKNKLPSYLIVLFFLFISVNELNAQSAKLIKAQKELEKTRTLLNSLNAKTTKAYMRYKILEKQIKLQETLLDNIKSEIDSIEIHIQNNSKERTKITKRIKELKGEYEDLIFYAYKTRNTRSKTIFIFSSKSFNQAYRRFVYLQYLTEYLEQTTFDLTQQTDSLKTLNKNLEIQKFEKLELKEHQTDELLKLNQSKRILASILEKLNSQKDQLREDLKQKELIAEKLRRSVKEDASKLNVSKKSKLSIDFENNKGKLPFPVKGIIASSFGQHTHSVLKNVKINNDGIEIATSPGAVVKCVHNGLVTKVLKIPGANNAVIIKHGEYFTVYSNLSDVFVNNGETISKGQDIGMPDSRVLNFQIWYMNKKLNPQHWLQ
jgi:septal ring factor EnvC (AmiA/AmiB activator)